MDTEHRVESQQVERYPSEEKVNHSLRTRQPTLVMVKSEGAGAGSSGGSSLVRSQDPVKALIERQPWSEWGRMLVVDKILHTTYDHWNRRL